VSSTDLDRAQIALDTLRATLSSIEDSVSDAKDELERLRERFEPAIRLVPPPARSFEVTGDDVEAMSWIYAKHSESGSASAGATHAVLAAFAARLAERTEAGGPEVTEADDVAHDLANTPVPTPFDPATAPPLAVLAHPGRSGRPAEVWVHADPGDTAPWMRHHLTPFGAGYDWRYTTEVPADAVPLVPAPAPFVRGVDELTDAEVDKAIWTASPYWVGYGVGISATPEARAQARRLYHALAAQMRRGADGTAGGAR
jgi:hypothetical protein